MPCSPSTHQVHPHACGENNYAKSFRGRRDGSPPRVWGKHIPNRHDDAARRFTPTRVGKTDWMGRDHDGEAGSPPRVWGKP